MMGMDMDGMKIDTVTMKSETLKEIWCEIVNDVKPLFLELSLSHNNYYPYSTVQKF